MQPHVCTGNRRCIGRKGADANSGTLATDMAVDPDPVLATFEETP
jgi:hypothetical protein